MHACMCRALSILNLPCAYVHCAFFRTEFEKNLHYTPLYALQYCNCHKQNDWQDMHVSQTYATVSNHRINLLINKNPGIILFASLWMMENVFFILYWISVWIPMDDSFLSEYTYHPYQALAYIRIHAQPAV